MESLIISACHRTDVILADETILQQRLRNRKVDSPEGRESILRGEVFGAVLARFLERDSKPDFHSWDGFHCFPIYIPDVN